MMELETVLSNDEPIYVLINKTNGAIVESTKKFLTIWFAKGFEVLEIKNVNAN